MPTTLYAVSNTHACAGIHRGSNSAKLDGATPAGWTTHALMLNRGTASVALNSTATVNGPTNGVECAPGGTPVEFISLPIAAAVTISGGITARVWGNSSSNSGNIAQNVVIDKLDNQGNFVSQIAKSANVGIMSTASTASNIASFTPTSTALAVGDRIRMRIFGDDASSGSGNMVTGFTWNNFISGPTSGAGGDTYVVFAETITFQTTVPTGTILYPTSTIGPAVGADDEREMSSARGASSANAVRGTATGYTTPLQWTLSNGGANIEWYSKPLQGFTLSGLVALNIRALESNGNANTSLRAELAICNLDGSGATVWAAASLVDSAAPGGAVGSGTNGQGELTTSEAPVRGWLLGPDVAVSTNQRLRLRLYADDAAAAAMGSGFTATVRYNGPTAAAQGDSWIQLPQTITEIGVSVSQAAYRFYEDGTESASVAIVAQDTAMTRVVDADSNVLLRARLQSTTVVDVPTSNWQLEWAKNGGAWTAVGAVGSEALADSYAETNVDTSITFLGTLQGVAQSIVGDGRRLSKVSFWMNRTGSPPGDTRAFLYSVTGTHGSTAVPAGQLTSSAAVFAASLPTTAGWVDFVFDDTVTLTLGTTYIIAVQEDSQSTSGNSVVVGVDASSPSHAGNHVLLNSSWAADATRDTVFRLYTKAQPGTVVALNSTNLTNQGATTNRLTGATGSFEAGRVSETGRPLSTAITANNFTEHLYALTLKAADLNNSDVLTFRILRLDLTTGMVYTQTPTITCQKGAVAGGKIKWWNGSAWVEKPVKWWNGSAWVEKPVKVWDGSAWVLS